LFRIDRSLVNLSTARSVHLDSNGREAGAEGGYPDAAASVPDIALVNEQAQEILILAESKAKEDADKVITSAREESALILLKVRDEAEEIRRQAWAEGFAQGSEEGKRSFNEQLEEKKREDDEVLRSVIQKLHDELKSTYDELEGEVVGLSMDIVKKIISPDNESSDAFEALIKNALKQVNPNGRIIIRVSPAEFERFYPSGGVTYILDGGMTVTASVLRDASLGTGDCIIDTEESTINAGIDSQMKYIELAFDRAKIEYGNLDGEPTDANQD